ncbi:MAG: LTA synthase family protein [Bacillota bacterium]|nr:LTA synthase family protein [Bacillota bacterium]
MKKLWENWKPQRKNGLLYCYFGMLLLFELVVRAWTVRPFFAVGLLLLCLLSLAGALLLSFLTLLLPEKLRRPAALLLTPGAALICGGQLVYYSYFNTYFRVFSMTHGGQAAQFWRDILREILQCGLPLLLLLAGVVLFELLLLRFTELRSESLRGLWKLPAAAALSLLLCAAATLAGDHSPNSPYDAAFRVNSIDASVEHFGVGTAFFLDGGRMLFGFHPAAPAESRPMPGDGEEEETAEVEETPLPPNVMDVDFEALAEAETDGTLAAMDRYFAQEEPSLQNEKTGLFRGKNLVMICGESFSSFAIHPVYTPTLYKLQNEGFTFTNFYNPIWDVSTIDGEYVYTQGLLPKAGTWSMQDSAGNRLPFTMGNQFRKLGYKTLAYHNHYAEYYGRTESHPNMGYTYKGLGTGLKVTEIWPESDLQMLELTTGEYVGQGPFHVYYMTVSGHKNYNFTGQNMCARHREAVADLEMSEACRAYLACHIELDLAMEHLLRELEAAGELEDTVIVLCGDHYPYGLTEEEMSEFLGHPVDPVFEMYKSSLILYNSATPPETVDKPCSSLDVLPTLSNLFGLEYDSRLLAGRDVFSDAPALVMFNDRSWITELAFYNGKTGEVTLRGSASLPRDYVEQVNQVVFNKFWFSQLILETDYYARVLGDNL